MEDYITAETIASEVMMQMLAHSGQFLVVEGSDDVKLYGKFVDKEFCMLIDARGRVNARDSVRCLLGRGVKRAIAIIDNDYESLISYSEEENIFITDENDAEMMLVCSSAFDNLLDERMDKEKWKAFQNSDGKAPREIFMSLAAQLGAIRLCSKKFNLMIDFKSLSWRFFNQVSLTCDKNLLFDAVFRANQTMCLSKGLSAVHLQEMVDEEFHMHSEDRSLCRGHDVTKIISSALKHAIGNSNAQVVSKEEIEACLRMIYRWEDFKLTGLCRKIQEWEKEHGRIFRFS